MAIHPLIEQDKDYIISLRRWFHSHPELSMKEFETAKRIEEELNAIGIPTFRVGATGVLGTIRGKRGPSSFFRTGPWRGRTAPSASTCSPTCRWGRLP